MITKHELREYRELKKELEDLKERIIRKEEQLKSARSQTLTGMPRGNGDEDDKIGAAIALIEELKNLYVEKMQMCEQKLKKIENEIDRLEPTERIIMRHRYIDGWQWEKICLSVNYSWAQIHKVHANILNELSKHETP